MDCLQAFVELGNSFVDRQIAARKGGYVPGLAQPSKLEHLYGCASCSYSEAGCKSCWETPFASRPASRAKPKKAHYQAHLPPAPTFRPTPEQFKDPFAYLAQIAPEASKAGIALIIPPEGWEPPIQMLDQETGMLRKDFKVPVRIQPTHLLCKRYPTPSGAPPAAPNSQPNSPTSSKGTGEQQKEKKSNAVTGRCSKSSMDAQKAALAAAAAAADEDDDEDKEAILNPAHLDAVATAAQATDGQFGYEHLEDPLSLHEFHRYADWAKRRHFNGPLMTASKRNGQLQRPTDTSDASSLPVTAASNAWRTYPCTPAVRAARGVAGKWIPGTAQASAASADPWGESWVEPSIEEVEAEFWRIVEAADEQVEALYGQDIDTATYSSAFPTIKELAQAEARHLLRPSNSNTKKSSSTAAVDKDDDGDGDDGTDPANVVAGCRCGRCQLCALRSYTRHPWNINNIPQAKGSVLRFVREDVGGKPITGLMVPWVYVGSCFSAFCWHIEDHGLYSVNYNHMGSPKVWYGVPASAAAALDAAMRDALPHLFAKDHLLLHKLVTMLSPSQLTARGVPVCRAVQVPGSFIVTFPDAYHAGFNSGFNVAEAVNFAAPDWLPFGSSSVVRYRCESRYMTFSHDAMLINVVREAVAAAAAAGGKQQQQEETAARHKQLKQLPAPNAASSSLMPQGLQSAAPAGLRSKFAAGLQQAAQQLVQAEAAAAEEHWNAKQQQQQQNGASLAAVGPAWMVAPPGAAAAAKPAVSFSSSPLETPFWWEAFPDASWSEAAEAADQADAVHAALAKQQQQQQQKEQQHHGLLRQQQQQEEGKEHHLAAASQQHHQQGQRERVFTMRGAAGAAAAEGAVPSAMRLSPAVLARAARGLAAAVFGRPKPAAGSLLAAAAAHSSSSGVALSDPKAEAAVGAIVSYIIALAEERRRQLLVQPPSSQLARLAIGELALRLELEQQRQQALMLKAGISRMSVMQGDASAVDPATGVHTNTKGVECATCGCDLTLAAVVSGADPGRAVCPEHAWDLDGTRSECCLLLRYAPGQLEQLLAAAVKLVPGAADAVRAARARRGWVAAGRFIAGAVVQKKVDGSSESAAADSQREQQQPAVAVKQEPELAAAAAVVKQEGQQQEECSMQQQQQQQEQQDELQLLGQLPVVEVKLLGRLYDPADLNSKLFEDLEETSALSSQSEDESSDTGEEYTGAAGSAAAAGSDMDEEIEEAAAAATGCKVAAAAAAGVKQEQGEDQEAAQQENNSGAEQSSGSWWEEELDGQEDAFGFYTFADAGSEEEEEEHAADDSDVDFRPSRGARGASRKRRRAPAAAAAARKRAAAADGAIADMPVPAAAAVVAAEAAA